MERLAEEFAGYIADFMDGKTDTGDEEFDALTTPLDLGRFLAAKATPCMVCGKPAEVVYCRSCNHYANMED